MKNPQQPGFGYIFYPSKQKEKLDHPQLDIILSQTPSGVHFDPEEVEFHVVANRDEIQPLTVEHPWTQLNNYRVTAGRVIIRNKQNKRHEAFTYGGELNIQVEAQQTICSLTSPAPIFNLDFKDPTTTLVVEETEILMAERRAAWANDLDEYEKLLAKVDPEKLFAACVIALSKKFQRLPRTGESDSHNLSHYLSLHREELQHRGILTHELSLKEIL